MAETAIVEFVNNKTRKNIELEIPLSITANELIIALNHAFGLGMDIDNIFDCYLVADRPMAFLKGNKKLKDFNIRNGSLIIYKGND